jgi:hypothetical protein
VRGCSRGGACERGVCVEMLLMVLVRRCSRGAHREVLVRRCSQGGAREEMLTRRCLRGDAHKEVLVRRC